MRRLYDYNSYISLCFLLPLKKEEKAKNFVKSFQNTKFLIFLGEIDRLKAEGRKTEFAKGFTRKYKVLCRKKMRVEDKTILLGISPCIKQGFKNIEKENS